MRARTRLSLLLFLISIFLPANPMTNMIKSAKSARSSLVNLKEHNPTIVCCVYYATENNFTKKILYPSAEVYLVKEVAAALNTIQKKLSKLGLGLKVFDGYRPASVQQFMWDSCPQFHQYIRDPMLGSNHSRGAAVDLTLIDLKTGKELEMPSKYDDLSEKAHRNYAKMTLEAAKNCKLLTDSMCQNGFQEIPQEWWHYNWTESVKHPEKYPVLDISFDELEHLAK